MADNQVVIFSLLNEEYGLDITTVQEIIRYQEVTSLPEAPDFIKGIVNIRGQIIPVIDLKLRFYGINSEINDATRIIVVKVGDKVLGIIADQVSEVLRIPEEAIEPTPTLIREFNTSGIVGVGKLEDRLVMFLDLAVTLTGKELNLIAEVV